MSSAHIAGRPRPWRWVPTLYFGQGLPYVVVMTLSVVLYKRLGLGNTEIAFYTSWLYLPWVVKPLWSPLVELLGHKRTWVLSLQFLIGALLASVALTLPLPAVLQLSLALFWLMAFASATHDIAADGLYMLALPEHTQAAFVGVRSTFYRLSMIAGQGGLIYLAGTLEVLTGNVVYAWSVVFAALGALLIALALWHLVILPRSAADVPVVAQAIGARARLAEAFGIFARFFARRDILIVLAFLLTFRLGEAQLLKLVTPFLLDARSAGGLGLDTRAVGLLYGGFGIALLTAGGILGGWTISRVGLARAMVPMILAVNVPNLLYVALALVQPESRLVIGAAIGIEQFGYGFGFAAYLMYMILVAQGATPTAHYALATGFMALGMMLPGFGAGALQTALGYPLFFGWVCLCALPALVLSRFLVIDPGFGRRPVEDPAR
jgi:PAT family beta-lactamase induction signal transducer AmpG